MVALGVLLASSAAGCSRKLTQEDCNHLLGRAVGLATYTSGNEAIMKDLGLYAGVPIDLEDLRKNAQGAVKQTITDFDKACVGAPDENASVLCARRAKTMADLEACGGSVSKAREAAKIVRLSIRRKYSVDECGKYAEQGVKIGAASADEVSKLIKDCEDWMSVGMYECRTTAKDKAAWNACT